MYVDYNIYIRDYVRKQLTCITTRHYNNFVFT